MAIQVALNHKTVYRYDRPVSLSPHIIRLRPAPHCRTPVHAYSLNITPKTHFINWQQDPFGNYLARLVFPETTSELSIEVDLVAEMTVINPFDFFLEESADKYPFEYDAQHTKELLPYLEVHEQGPRLREWVAHVDRKPRRTVDFLVDLNSRLQRDVGYGIRLEPGIQSCEETLDKRKGSCRDTAWLQVQILRHLGLAARFVSGYLVQLVADIKPVDGPAGPQADFTDLHAWTEVYVPGAGWIGLDPTSGLFAGEGHIPLACTPDPMSAAPVTGSAGPCESSFEFANTVQRFREAPRITKPYAPEQWERINHLGMQVDGDLQAADVRLTMGGEPTFVAKDNTDAPEWNTEALGTRKKQLAESLIKRMSKRFGAGGLFHFGQGKWYPGEPLPRWALSYIWRKDEVPLWRDPAWIADEGCDYGFKAEHAQFFAVELCRQLQLDRTLALPAYEDVYYYLWKEQTLPINVDPLKSDLKDSLERQRLARLLESGLGTVAGYILPLKWRYTPGAEGWQSGAWTFRRGRLYLLPGTSPMGYRLPLDSLPWIDPSQLEPDVVRCPTERQPPLGPHPGSMARSGRASGLGPPSGSVAERLSEQSLDAAPGEPVGAEAMFDVVRTALCVEPRDGKLYVFLPPVSYLEHFVELIAAIEATAAELQFPVLIEGYTPPYDSRVEKFQVTPDPGVIEVNLPPAASWSQLVAHSEGLYEEADHCRLSADKFMLDGRHTGTGGGNHVTLGGPTPADSPLLRRPDLLQSLLTFWQHHPSLSYLFSGLFIGPTSQTPRVDEARHESLYELEIAFQQMPRDRTIFPWITDRLLRHLLIDMTGNTHRAEFCIDKLYSPDSATGRLGILELRGFEMPPHPRMSLLQVLVLRALVSRFWKSPYDRPLVRWGTELHDRFLLPHYVWRDFEEVLGDLARHGYDFEPIWFEPFMEFRFPQYGVIDCNGIQLELRMAVEPWHVLGEEVSSGGTSRYVDSSVERLQVKVEGMTDPRHVVLCNGRPVPLRRTGVPGEFVAGVRFRAWQPPSALHPTIPVHSPLVFDLVDTWNDRAIGGCTYHVSHPGGRSAEIFPVNANEAESRRLARFWPYGHTPGTLTVPTEEQNRDYPYTLDLRRQ